MPHNLKENGSKEITSNHHLLSLCTERLQLVFPASYTLIKMYTTMAVKEKRETS